MKSIGIVKTERITVAHAPNELLLESGAKLGPIDITYEIGSILNKINWKPTAIGPVASRIYSIFRNNSIIESGNWESEVDVSISVDDLTPGIYNYTIILDGDELSVSDMVKITVKEDFISINSPIDITYEVGSTSNEIEWKPIANSVVTSRTYSIYRNGSVVDSGTWISGENISISIDSLGVGTFNYTIILNGDELLLSA